MEEQSIKKKGIKMIEGIKRVVGVICKDWVGLQSLGYWWLLPGYQGLELNPQNQPLYFLINSNGVIHVSMSLKETKTKLASCRSHMSPSRFTTSVRVLRKWHASLKTCLMKLEKLQIQHRGKVASLFHRRETTMQDSYASGDLHNHGSQIGIKHHQCTILFF